MQAYTEKYDTRHLVTQLRRDERRRKTSGIAVVAAIIVATWALTTRQHDSVMSRANRLTSGETVVPAMARVETESAPVVAVAPPVTAPVQAAPVAPVAVAAVPSVMALPLFGDYLVQPGDSLAMIAEKTLGDRRLLSLIELSNRDVLSDPERIQAGMHLRIPQLPRP